MLPRTRQVAALDGAGRVSVITEALPELRAGMVLVAVHASVISPGTELAGVPAARQQNPPSSAPPRPFGYQNAGVVVAVGTGVSEFIPGQRVACMGAGYAVHGDYAVVPQRLCTALPDAVSFAAGASAHLAVTALHALRRGEPQLGETLVVAGLGLVGQFTARLAQLAGMTVMGWDRYPRRCELARQWGIDATATIGQEDEVAATQAFTGPQGLDMAVLAFGGDGSAALERLKLVMTVSADGHRVGRICLVGGLQTHVRWGASMGHLDLRSCARSGPGYHDDAWELGERDYPRGFVRWTTRSNLELVLRLMASKRLPVLPLLTHRFPLAQVEDAVEAHLQRQDSTLGTVLEMPQA